jgi:signal transduction histidine kinase
MILIVDDNQENIFSLKALLELHQFSVDNAHSGEEALKKILQNSYSLIILDVQMPDMDGFEVAEAISGYSKSKDIPIIFLSAVNTHKKFITKGYTSGGIDYVTKPFDPDILLLKIKTFYRLSEQTRMLNEMELSLREEIERRKEAESVLEKRVAERTGDLQKANQRLEESNSELRQFAFIASHDLQEPLRKIQTFTNVAIEKYIDEKDKLSTVLGKISSSAARLRKLISGLLEYSRIYVDDQFVPTDLGALIGEVVSDLDINKEQCQIELDVSNAPLIDAIPLQLYSVFQNLVSNAVKFSNKQCRIEICVDLIHDIDWSEGGYCRITVKDNGIGFNEQFSEKIFEIFQRLNHSRIYDGTGIGLAIVKKVVERHNGTITASGKENEGATFTITLPVKHKYQPASNPELNFHGK